MQNISLKIREAPVRAIPHTAWAVTEFMVIQCDHQVSKQTQALFVGFADGMSVRVNLRRIDRLTILGGMVPQLAFVDWVALVIASVLFAAVGAALVVAWIASRHKKRMERAALVASGDRTGRTMVKRATSERARITAMMPDEAEAKSAAGEASTVAKPVPETRPATILDAPASAKAPVLANGVAGNGFALRQPGFFEDPIGRHDQRYWDGSRWTEYVKEEGQRFIDPL